MSREETANLKMDLIRYQTEIEDMRLVISSMDGDSHLKAAQRLKLEVELKRMRSINQEDTMNYEKLLAENKAYEQEIQVYETNYQWMKEQKESYEKSLVPPSNNPDLSHEYCSRDMHSYDNPDNLTRAGDHQG